MVHDIDRIIEILKTTSTVWRDPAVTEIAQRDKDPFKILISTIISLRTKDNVTREASERLYNLADTLETIIKLSRKKIESRILYT